MEKRGFRGKRIEREKANYNDPRIERLASLAEEDRNLHDRLIQPTKYRGTQTASLADRLQHDPEIARSLLERIHKDNSKRITFISENELPSTKQKLAKATEKHQSDDIFYLKAELETLHDEIAKREDQNAIIESAIAAYNGEPLPEKKSAEEHEIQPDAIAFLPPDEGIIKQGEGDFEYPEKRELNAQFVEIMNADPRYTILYDQEGIVEDKWFRDTPYHGYAVEFQEGDDEPIYSLAYICNLDENATYIIFPHERSTPEADIRLYGQRSKKALLSSTDADVVRLNNPTDMVEWEAAIKAVLKLNPSEREVNKKPERPSSNLHAVRAQLKSRTGIDLDPRITADRLDYLSQHERGAYGDTITYRADKDGEIVEVTYNHAFVERFIAEMEKYYKFDTSWKIPGTVASELEDEGFTISSRKLKAILDQFREEYAEEFKHFLPLRGEAKAITTEYHPFGTVENISPKLQALVAERAKEVSMTPERAKVWKNRGDMKRMFSDRLTQMGKTRLGDKSHHTLIRKVVDFMTSSLAESDQIRGFATTGRTSTALTPHFHIDLANEIIEAIAEEVAPNDWVEITSVNGRKHGLQSLEQQEAFVAEHPESAGFYYSPLPGKPKQSSITGVNLGLYIKPDTWEAYKKQTS